jgi:homoserine trans-succinylase
MWSAKRKRKTRTRTRRRTRITQRQILCSRSEAGSTLTPTKVDALAQVLEHEIDDRRRVESEYLRNAETANDGYAERTAEF